MPRKRFGLLVLGILSIASTAQTYAVTPSLATTKANRDRAGILWHQPERSASLNFYYGIGGRAHEPHGPFAFVEEDLNGTNPKYVVRDKEGVKWTIKLGMEARPETVASRLVWAAGYFADEDYFMPVLRVSGVPAHLQRGRKLVALDGTMHDARLKRHSDGEKTIGTWQWRNDPFTGTREYDGLKVMMALLNNWDLKDANNKVYGRKEGRPPVYEVSDLGATFGPTGLTIPFSRSRGDLGKYEHSGFITRLTPEFVDFSAPSRPALIYAFSPIAFAQRVRLDSLLHRIPRSDVRWIATILAGFSDRQIRDAFRAAHYPQPQIDAFSDVLEGRIAQLRAL